MVQTNHAVFPSVLLLVCTLTVADGTASTVRSLLGMTNDSGLNPQGAMELLLAGAAPPEGGPSGLSAIAAAAGAAHFHPPRKKDGEDMNEPPPIATPPSLEQNPSASSALEIQPTPPLPPIPPSLPDPPVGGGEERTQVQTGSTDNTNPLVASLDAAMTTPIQQTTSAMSPQQPQQAQPREEEDEEFPTQPEAQAADEGEEEEEDGEEEEPALAPYPPVPDTSALTTSTRRSRRHAPASPVVSQAEVEDEEEEEEAQEPEDLQNGQAQDLSGEEQDEDDEQGDGAENDASLALIRQHKERLQHELELESLRERIRLLQVKRTSRARTTPNPNIYTTLKPPLSPSHPALPSFPAASFVAPAPGFDPSPEPVDHLNSKLSQLYAASNPELLTALEEQERRVRKPSTRPLSKAKQLQQLLLQQQQEQAAQAPPPPLRRTRHKRPPLVQAGMQDQLEQQQQWQQPPQQQSERVLTSPLPLSHPPAASPPRSMGEAHTSTHTHTHRHHGTTTTGTHHKKTHHNNKNPKPPPPPLSQDTPLGNDNIQPKPKGTEPATHSNIVTSDQSTPTSAINTLTTPAASSSVIPLAQPLAQQQSATVAPPQPGQAQQAQAQQAASASVEAGAGKGGGKGEPLQSSATQKGVLEVKDSKHTRRAADDPDNRDDNDDSKSDLSLPYWALVLVAAGALLLGCGCGYLFRRYTRVREQSGYHSPDAFDLED